MYIIQFFYMIYKNKYLRLLTISLTLVCPGLGVAIIFDCKSVQGSVLWDELHSDIVTLYCPRHHHSRVVSV